MPTSHIGFP